MRNIHFQSFKYLRFVALLALVLLPFLTTVVHSICCHQNLFVGIPHNSDEFCYWRVLYSFSRRGFDIASTCGFLGREAPVGPLGEHGISPLFAWLGALPFRIGFHTLFLWNITALSLALALFVLLAKPNIPTVLWAGILVLGNGVVIEQWYSHMMELPCLAVTIIYFSLALAWEETGRRAFLWLALIVCAYASFMRVCYIILAFPLILRLCFPPGKRSTPWPFFAYLVVFVAIRQTGALFMKPSNGFLTDIADMGFRNVIPILANHFISNFGRYFSFTNGTNVEIGQRWFQIALIVVLIIAAFLARRNGKLIAAIAYFANAVSLAGLIVMLMLLYDIASWRDVRTTMSFTIGMSIWFVAKSFSTSGGLSRLSGATVRGALLISTICCLIAFTPARFASNHPADRFGDTSFDLSWLADIPDEKLSFCIFEPFLSPGRQIALYKHLPPRVGIIIATKEKVLIRAKTKPNFVLTSHRLSIPEYRIWKDTKDFALLYRKCSPPADNSVEAEY